MTDSRFPPHLALAVLDAIPIHVAVLNAAGVIVAVNAAWRRFALDNAREPGVMPSNCEVGGNYLSVCDAARGEDAATAAAAADGIRRVLAGEIGEFFLEYPCHSPRQPRWFLMRVNRLAAGQGVVMAHMDMTRRKLAELALHDSELRLNLALEASGDGLWDWNLVSGEVYLSPSYYALTGYRADEVVSDLAFFQRLVHPNDWPGVFATIGAHLRGESAISEIEYRMLTADGSEKWILGRGRVVARDAAGTPLRMIGHITDISACKRLERDFRESEARYRGVVEDQTEVIARIRADGTFVFANEIYCRLFGKKAEEVIGRKWQPIAHPDDLAMIEAHLAQLRPDNPVVVIENRVYAGDGSLRWMQFVNRGFFDEAGSLREIQSVGRDISERKRLEQERWELLGENTRLGQELIRMQEAERSRLARELHDELSQELVAVRAHAAALRLRHGPEVVRADAAAIEAAAGRIYAVSHRIMEGLHPQILESAGLEQALETMCQDWRRQCPTTQLRLRVAGPLAACRALGSDSENWAGAVAHVTPMQPEIPKPDRLLALPTGEMRIHLYRIVQASLSNVAAHAQAAHARVWIGHGRRQGQATVRLVCRDDGCGMDTHARHPGYGLLMMRERSRALGGHFDLQSRPGAGVRIQVDLPLPTGA